MKKINCIATCLVIGVSVCICACKSTKNNNSAPDRYRETAQAGGPGFFGRPDGMGMPPGGGQGMPPGDRQGMPPGGRQGMPPGGMPPGGGQGMPPGGMPPGGRFDENMIQATLMVDAEDVTQEGKRIKADKDNQSAVAVFKDSHVELKNNEIVTSGNTTSQDMSSFQGLNAAVLGRDDSELRLSDNSITTSGLGANAIFAYGNSVIYSDRDVINCTGDGGHGIMCSGGGTIHATNIDITTSGKNSAPVATDRGSGTITVQNGRIVSHGQDSPGLYSTGQLSLEGVSVSSDGSEVAVIEGSNQIRLDNCRLTCSFPRKWGIMIYQSFSGDAEGADGEFEAVNSSIRVTGEDSPLFFVTNSTAYITLDGNEIECVSGILLNAAASRWGNEGENGGTAVITTHHQVLEGDLQADANSNIRLSLTEGSVLKGSVNHENSAKSAEVRIDDNSRWELTGDAYVSLIEAEISGDNVTNILGNGHTIYYDPDNNPTLGGKTYSLQGGGVLQAKQ